MESRIFRWWRVLATGSSFALFGLAGLVVALALPVLDRLPGTKLERESRAQRLIHRMFRAFVGYMRAVGILDVTVHGAERLRAPGGLLLAANHPTLLDVVMMGALMPQLDCVVKKEAWSNPFMRGPIVAAGYIPNEAGDELIDLCAERAARGRCVLIFPEGTRSPKGALGPLRRGAAHMALRSGRPLVPVFIGCDPPSLMRGQSWYDVPVRPMQYTIEIGDRIEVAPTPQRRGAAARQLTASLREFYEKRMAAGTSPR